eukprot:Mycagemm_TRINITY_DN10339_c3_g5::TRINITY_DN10339_c3_g5_i2::g.971::m.971 type:complete len:104 gc:universal TRINITY_DN10339_c3_g5_i2:557-246(-)
MTLVVWPSSSIMWSLSTVHSIGVRAERIFVCAASASGRVAKCASVRCGLNTWILLAHFGNWAPNRLCSDFRSCLERTAGISCNVKPFLPCSNISRESKRMEKG